MTKCHTDATTTAPTLLTYTLLPELEILSTMLLNVRLVGALEKERDEDPTVALEPVVAILELAFPFHGSVYTVSVFSVEVSSMTIRARMVGSRG